jgi:hypothetical protein
MSLTPAPARPLTVLSQDTYAAFGEPLTGLGGGGAAEGASTFVSTLNFTENPGYINFLLPSSISSTSFAIFGESIDEGAGSFLNTINMEADLINTSGGLQFSGTTIAAPASLMELTAQNVGISSIVGLSSINGLPYLPGGSASTVSSFTNINTNLLSTGLITIGYGNTGLRISTIGSDPDALFVGSGQRAVYLDSRNNRVNIDAVEVFIAGTSLITINGTNWASLVAVVNGLSTIPP